MSNFIKYGLIIGIVSGIWLLIMHFAGVFNPEKNPTGNISWLEYVSIIIPLIGLYTGIKSFRDGENGGKMEFFEGLFEGFKIMVVSGVIVSFFAVIYISYVPSVLKGDYMGRIGGALIVGMLFNLASSLILMNKQKAL
ncbi:DUF4199 family protein [Pedobacter sp. HMF7647]|uniref:DUF4199 family protein n=1 Tax=Hufsiella arboris TaxID=2695275 RepID=A0A7K1Y5E2_9SPHI|nr:DUF4199 domain-containing protein [Hufsiella arboris]MXV49802.1 DUF4199 family protein [Hufsiella arboris]